MLYGYCIVQGMASVRARAKSARGPMTYPLAPALASELHARARQPEPAPAFPPRYGGAFGRQDAESGHPVPGRRGALSMPARSMLERELGREAAERMISVVERMAAAAAGARDGAVPPR